MTSTPSKQAIANARDAIRRDAFGKACAWALVAIAEALVDTNKSKT